MIVAKDKQSEAEEMSPANCVNSTQDAEKCDVIVPAAKQKSEKFKSMFSKRKKPENQVDNDETVKPVISSELSSVLDDQQTSNKVDTESPCDQIEEVTSTEAPKKGKLKNIFRRKETAKHTVQDGSPEESTENSVTEEVVESEQTTECNPPPLEVSKKKPKFSMFHKSKALEYEQMMDDPQSEQIVPEEAIQSDNKEATQHEEIDQKENRTKSRFKNMFYKKKDHQELVDEILPCEQPTEPDAANEGDPGEAQADQPQKDSINIEVVPTANAPDKGGSSNKFKSIFKKKTNVPESEVKTLNDKVHVNPLAENDHTEETVDREPEITANTSEDVISKKSKFSLFSSKKKDDKSDEQELPSDTAAEGDKPANHTKADYEKKEKFRSLFSKQKRSEEHPLLPDDSISTKDNTSDNISVSEIEANESPKKDTFRNLFKSNKKIDSKHDVVEEQDNADSTPPSDNTELLKATESEIPSRPKKEKFLSFTKKKKLDKESTPHAPDTNSHAEESVLETTTSGSDKEVIKKDKFKSLFQRKKETESEGESQPNEPSSDKETELSTELKLSKSKSFLRLSKRSKKKDKKKSEEEEDVPVEVQEDLKPKKAASLENLKTNENPAVLPLNLSFDNGRAPYKGSSYSLDEEEVVYRKGPKQENSMKDRPAVVPLSDPMREPGGTLELGEDHIESTNISTESLTENPKAVSGDNGIFMNIFKKKKSTVDLVKDQESDDLKEVSESEQTDPVIAEKSKSKNIFKRKKKIPIEDTVAPAQIDEGNELEEEYLAIAPITMLSTEKPTKPSKTWSERMKLPTKKMDPSSKESSRNEDNEMDIPDDRMLMDDSESAVKLINETMEPSNITIEEQMQLLCDLFGHESDVIWDSYTANQKEALKNKLKLVLDPGTNNAKKKNIEKYINDMTEAIWNQSKYTDGVLNMGIIFVALLNEKELDVRKAKKFSLRPVFRTVRCYDKTTKSTKGCCMMFIDETGRVYTNWQHFMAENTYDPCVIVAPSQGVFNTDAKGKICLEFFTAPSSSVGAKILSITDKTATVTGLGASACFIGGMLTVALLPVAAPAIGIAMAGAGLVGAASAGYSMVRSTQKMKDLSEHEKSLNIKDAEARGHWLSLIGSMTGFVSGVASHGVDLMARSGHHIPAFFRGSIDAINAASIAVNGVGVIDGFSTVFLKWNEEKISTLEIMQLSASLFMFTHSMYNFETTNAIIKKHHDITVNEFRDKLGQTQRQHYHKMAQESLKVHGKGHRDVIRSLRAIPNQADFQKMHKADNAITEGMVTAATLLVAKFCKKYFVVDENDLTNTILNAMTLLSDHAFDVFMEVVEHFVESKGELVQRSLRGIISVEEVMSDILTSVTSISESLGLDASEFIETLTKTDNFLKALIDRIYDMYKDYERVEPNQTCAECKGVFTVRQRDRGGVAHSKGDKD